MNNEMYPGCYCGESWLKRKKEESRIDALQCHRMVEESKSAAEMRKEYFRNMATIVSSNSPVKKSWLKRMLSGGGE